MVEEHGKRFDTSRPESIRGTQKTVQPNSDSLGLGAVGGAGQGNETQSLGDGRKDCEGNNSSSTISQCIAKKILDQLIDDTRDQLEKSRECIDWYIRESAEYEEKLKSLNELRAMAESNEHPSQSP